MIFDSLVNTGVFIVTAVIPLGILLLILRAATKYFSQRKKAKVVKERLADAGK